MNYRLLLFLCLILWQNIARAQDCANNYNVNLSANPESTYSISAKRQGDCCGDQNCISFTITVHPDADLISFKADQITGASFYTINCGPQIPIGTPACITGLSTVNISFCKPGNNLVNYTIATSVAVKPSPDITLRQGCTGSMSVTGLNPATTTWTSIYPGTQGTYNQYLSQTSGTNTVNVTPGMGAPPYIDYRVSGNQSTGCSDIKTAVIRVYTVLPLLVAISPANPVICAGNAVTLTATASGGNTPYQYTWSTGETTQSIQVNTPGTYTVSIIDNTANCAPVIQTVTVGSSPTPAPPTASNVTICSGNTATLTASSAQTGIFEWFSGPSGGVPLHTGTTFITPALTSQTVYYVQFSAGGCPSARSAVTVNITPVPVAPSAGGVTVCSGASAALSATAPGGTYQWYDAASGGNLLGTGPGFNTVNLTTSTTFYVQTTINGCTSARTAVPVTVTPTPAVPTVNTPTICPGNSTVLTASAPGGIYRWYDAPAGGNLLQTGNTYTTPVLNTTTNYYVESEINGCTGPRATATVMVYTRTVPEFTYSSGTYCRSGSDPIANVISPNGGTFSAPAGLVFLDHQTGEIDVSASVIGTYTVSFTSNGPCPLTTTAQLTITDSPDASFSYATPFCEKTGANPFPVFPAGSSAGVFSSSSGLVFANASTGEIDIQASAPGTYTITNTIAASGGCAADIKTFNITIHPVPTVDAGADQVVCQGATASLTGTAANYSSVLWSAPAGSGTFTNAGALSTDFTPNTGITSVLLTLTVNPLPGSGCGVYSDQVLVQFSSPPAAPSVQDATICSGSTAILTATAPGGVYRWYTDASGGVLIHTGASFATPGLTSNTTYYVETLLNGCTSTRTPVTVTINPIPAAPTAAGTTICAGSTAALSISSAGDTFAWYDAPAGGNLLGTGQSFQTPVLNQNTRYYAEVTTGTCTSATRTEVLVTVNPSPDAPEAAPQVICAGTSATLTISNPIPGATYEWFADQNTTISVTGTSINTGSLQVTSVYYVRAIVNNCPSARTPVTITVNPIPVAPAVAGKTICSGSRATLDVTAPGGTYRWYTTSTGGTSFFTGPTYTTDPLSVSTTYYVESTLNSCTGDRTAVTVTVNPIPAPPAAESITICSGSVANLAITSTGDSFAWFDAPAGGNAVGFDQSFQTPALTQTTTYYAEVTIGGCVSARTPVMVTVNPIPPAPTVAGTTICAGSTASLNISSSGDTFAWYTAPTGGSAVASGQVFQTPVLNQTTTYYAEVITGGCASSRTAVTVTVNPIPAAPAAASLAICTGSAATLNITSAGDAFVWYDAAFGGSMLASGQTFRTPSLYQTTTYYAEVTTGGCTSPRTAVTVTVSPIPQAPIIADTYICVGSSATLTAPAMSGLYEWFDAANGGNLLYQGQVFVTPALQQSTLYYVNLTINGCSGPRAAVRVYTNPIPAAPVITAPITVCNGQNIQLSTPQLNGASYQWSGPNGFSSSARAPLIANSTGVNSGIYRLRITVNGCASPESSINISVAPLNMASAGTNRTVCKTSTEVQLNGTIGGSNTAVWSSTGTGIFQPNNYVLNARYLPSVEDKTAGSVTITLTTTANTGCPPASSAFTLSFAEPPTANAGTDQVLCANIASVTLMGQYSNADAIIWTTSGTGSFSDINNLQPVYTPSVADRQAGQVRLQITASGASSCANVTDEMILTLVPAPYLDAGTDRTVFLNRTFRLSPSVRDPDLIFSWTPNLYMDDPTLRNPLFTAKEDQLYTLVITDKLGCQSQDDVAIKVLKPIDIPNTFTPNGDGTNDYWEIKELAAYSKASVMIYNRYGESLYYSTGYEIPWDGTYKGSPLPVGTYYYVIRTNFENMIFSGSITILR